MIKSIHIHLKRGKVIGYRVGDAHPASTVRKSVGKTASKLCGCQKK